MVEPGLGEEGEMRVEKGTLLIPSDYLLRNGEERFGLVLEVIPRDGLEPDFLVMFSDGFVNRVSMDGVVSLFEVVG